MDDRICIPSPAAIRHQLGIEDADPRVFRANGLDEAIAVAREIWWDEMIAPEIRRHLIVGLTLDLLPGDLSPSRRDLARRVGVSARTVRRHELLWFGIDPILRFDLTRRAIRAIIVRRAATR